MSPSAPGGAPLSDFTIDSLTAERAPDGRPMILAMVHNTGQRALDMDGTLQLLDGPGGLSAGPFRQPRDDCGDRCVRASCGHAG